MGAAYLLIAPAISGRTATMVMHPGRQVTLPQTLSACRRTNCPKLYYRAVSNVHLLSGLNAAYLELLVQVPVRPFSALFKLYQYQATRSDGLWITDKGICKSGHGTFVDDRVGISAEHHVKSWEILANQSRQHMFLNLFP